MYNGDAVSLLAKEISKERKKMEVSTPKPEPELDSDPDPELDPDPDPELDPDPDPDPELEPDLEN